MVFQILKFLVAIFIFSRLAHQQSTPEQRCRDIGDGYVCTDCSRMGKCEGGKIVSISPCPTTVQTYCDDSIQESQYYGSCASLPESYTNCTCSSLTQCVADPNNPAVVLHCESEPPVSDPACTPASAIDLSICRCASCSNPEVCPLVDDPNDDCASYFFCNGNSLEQRSCSAGFCFSQSDCVCLESGETTSTTSTAPTPPPNCPLLDDPTDDCGKYYIYNGTSLIPVTCVGTLCFNQTLCGCVEQGSSSTTTSASTTTTINPDCPLFDDPTDNCGSFFVLVNGVLVQETCPDNQCFDQASCGCVNNGGASTAPATTTLTTKTTTITTTTTPSTTCPPGCPFLEISNSDCGDFYICDDGNLIESRCPGSLCFYQTSCQCA